MRFQDFMLLGFDIRRQGDYVYSADSLVWEKTESCCRKLEMLGYSVHETTDLFECSHDIIEKNISPDGVDVAVAIGNKCLPFLKKSYYSPFIEDAIPPDFLLAQGW